MEIDTIYKTSLTFASTKNMPFLEALTVVCDSFFTITSLLHKILISNACETSPREMRSISHSKKTQLHDIYYFLQK